MSEKVSQSAKGTTNHDEIRRWVEERGGHPACVKGTGHGQDDAAVIRIDFPGYSGEESLQQITWDEWFRQFDENNLELLISPEHGNRFNKIVRRGGSQEPHQRAA